MNKITELDNISLSIRLFKQKDYQNINDLFLYRNNKIIKNPSIIFIDMDNNYNDMENNIDKIITNSSCITNTVLGVQVDIVSTIIPFFKSKQSIISDNILYNYIKNILNNIDYYMNNSYTINITRDRIINRYLINNNTKIYFNNISIDLETLFCEEKDIIKTNLYDIIVPNNKFKLSYNKYNIDLFGINLHYNITFPNGINYEDDYNNYLKSELGMD